MHRKLSPPGIAGERMFKSAGTLCFFRQHTSFGATNIVFFAEGEALPPYARAGILLPGTSVEKPTTPYKLSLAGSRHHFVEMSKSRKTIPSSQLYVSRSRDKKHDCTVLLRTSSERGKLMPNTAIGCVEPAAPETTEKPKRDTQSRKWLLTINNPIDKGYTHESIHLILTGIKSIIYWCMSDEMGNETHTLHTHVFLQGRGGINFSTLRKRFPGADLEMARGTAQQNMEYVSKTGKWKDDKKSDTSIPGTFEEWGEMPVERQGRRNDLDDLYSMIKDGYTDYQILEVMPESLLNLDKLDKVRQVIRYESYKDTFRNLDVHYIYGYAGVGKTRFIMENYGFSNVFRVTDYIHPFDNYRGQDVVVFEEFRSSLSFSDMLNYLDGYPLELPCRYTNKYACYTKVYIVSNIPLIKQYPNVQSESPDSWSAFIRRINAVMHFTGSKINVQKIEKYTDGFYYITPGEEVPFHDIEKIVGSFEV